MSSNLTRCTGWPIRHFRMIKLLRTNFHTSSLLNQNLTIVDKEVQDNKMDIMSHICENITYTPQISEKITKLLYLFPFSQLAVKSVLMNHPNLLKQDPNRIHSLCSVLVEFSDYDGSISQEDALYFVGGCPEVFQMSSEDFQHTMSTLFSETLGHGVPWNVLMRKSPQTLLCDPKMINKYLTFFADEFGSNNVCHVIGNNPGIVGMDMKEIEETMSYLYDTMGVSPYRISRSEELLSVSLDFLKLRYEFILRCGYYKHPDPKSKGSRPLEASPSPNVILEPSVERFVNKATPGLTMEEFFVFTTLFEEENSNKFSSNFLEDDVLEEDAEEERKFKEGYRGKPKSIKDPDLNKGKKRQIAGKKKYNY